MSPGTHQYAGETRAPAGSESLTPRTTSSRTRQKDSFIFGFRLAWRLSVELNNYENERMASPRVGGPGACFNSEEESQ